MSSEPVIRVERVSKSFRLASHRSDTLKGSLLGLLKRPPAVHYQALDDVSFEVRAGETLGVVGTNGSGKSTILKLITGIIKPTSGHVSVRGRISPLIELGAGFHPDFTGRENVYLNGAILGAGRKQMDAIFDEIVAFSEIGPFIDQPAKTYSSGMYMRLAFSIAVHIDPDILVVDEVMAVGDAAFRRKCIERIAALRAAGKTILLVAHDQVAMAALCDRVVWLEQGVVRMAGPAAEVLRAYDATSAIAEGDSPAVTVGDLEATGADGAIATRAAAGETLRLAYDWHAGADATVGWRLLVTPLAQPTPLLSVEAPPRPVAAGESGREALRWTVPTLRDGTYRIEVEAIVGATAVSSAGVTLELASGWTGVGAHRAEAAWLDAGAAVTATIASAPAPSPAP